MIAKLAGTLLTAAALLVAGSAVAQEKHPQPEMTPEQKAEMETYMKAATPGAPHKMLAGMAGSYSLKVKSWPGPGAPAVEDTGTATRSMALEGRVLVEDVQGSMMGMPFTGHGMTGYDNVSGKYWATWSEMSRTRPESASWFTSDSPMPSMFITPREAK